MRHSGRRRIALALSGAIVLALAGTALAMNLQAKPEVFNPGHAAVSDAASWVPGAGVPGGSDNRGLLLLMSQTVAFPPGASADATIKPVKNLKLSSLGFDHLVGTYCTNGSPRWDVETKDGGVYAIGCASGTHSNAGMPAGWERITFGNGDVQHLSGPAWPGFGNAKLSFLQVLVDEGPSATVLDNLKVNDIVIGSGAPGRGKGNDDNGKDDKNGKKKHDKKKHDNNDGGD
jgi:hypothetical protein